MFFCSSYIRTPHISHSSPSLLRITWRLSSKKWCDSANLFFSSLSSPLFLSDNNLLYLFFHSFDFYIHSSSSSFFSNKDNNFSRLFSLCIKNYINTLNIIPLHSHNDGKLNFFNIRGSQFRQFLVSRKVHFEKFYLICVVYGVHTWEEKYKRFYVKRKSIDKRARRETWNQ